MDDLIIRVLSGTASAFEEERLKRWRGQSPGNEAAFQDLARVWDLTTPEVQEVEAARPEVEAILDRADSMDAGPPLYGEARNRPDEPTRQARGSRKGTPWSWRPRGWWLLAASLAALCLGIPLARTLGPTPLAVHQAPPGQSLVVNLPDGSFVKLADGARLQEWEGSGERVVSLEGRAFFAVARDEERPFEVRTARGQVRVLGTRFELQAQPEALRTVVVEGRVEVSNEEGAVEVEAGEVAYARRDAPPSASTPGDVYDLLHWPQGILVFQGTPLRLVAAEVSRYFNRSLLVDRESLGERRITAWFQEESFSEVADALCQAAGAVCSQDGEGIRIEAPGAEGRTP